MAFFSDRDFSWIFFLEQVLAFKRWDILDDFIEFGAYRVGRPSVEVPEVALVVVFIALREFVPGGVPV